MLVSGPVCVRWWSNNEKWKGHNVDQLAGYTARLVIWFSKTTVILWIIHQSRVTGVSDVPKYGPCHVSPNMTDERSWHTSKLGNFARIFDFSTLVLLIFILWHSLFSNPPKIHIQSAENMVALDEIGGLSHAFRQGDEMEHLSGMSQSWRGDEQFVILQYMAITRNSLWMFVSSCNSSLHLVLLRAWNTRNDDHSQDSLGLCRNLESSASFAWSRCHEQGRVHPHR